MVSGQHLVVCEGGKCLEVGARGRTPRLLEHVFHSLPLTLLCTAYNQDDPQEGTRVTLTVPRLDPPPLLFDSPGVAQAHIGVLSRWPVRHSRRRQRSGCGWVGRRPSWRRWRRRQRQKTVPAARSCVALRLDRAHDSRDDGGAELEADVVGSGHRGSGARGGGCRRAAQTTGSHGWRWREVHSSWVSVVLTPSIPATLESLERACQLSFAPNRGGVGGCGFYGPGGNFSCCSDVEKSPPVQTGDFAAVGSRVQGAPAVFLSTASPFHLAV